MLLSEQWPHSGKSLLFLLCEAQSSDLFKDFDLLRGLMPVLFHIGFGSLAFRANDQGFVFFLTEV